jgi:hypothetical protein
MSETENSADRFIKWLDSIANSTLGKIGVSKGFHIWHSGGGCHHFRKDAENGCYVLVCHEGEIPETDPGIWMVGTYDAEGEEIHVLDLEYTLEEALDSASKLLAEV